MGVRWSTRQSAMMCNWKTLVPLWSERLGKSSMQALQVSPRGGELGCELVGERVLLRGVARVFLRATVLLD